jgi:DNA-binding transcriptional ArsR family regulator
MQNRPWMGYSPRVEPAPTRERRRATDQEAKALGHPLRLRILRLCGQRELTNKQLADRLGRDPGTVLYHVRQLVEAGLLEQAEVRTGESGALEKPYRSTGLSWWLDSSADHPGDPLPTPLAPFDAFREELEEAGPDSVQTFSRFTLRLSPEEVAELDEKIVALLDEYIATDDLRKDRPVLGGIFMMHRLAD